MTPTESAQNYFTIGYQRAIAAAGHTAEVQDETGIAVYDIAACLSALAKGLDELAVGMRATYMLLERLDQKMDRLPPR
jgi:hypothetical protein